MNGKQYVKFFVFKKGKNKKNKYLLFNKKQMIHIYICSINILHTYIMKLILITFEHYKIV